MKYQRKKKHLLFDDQPAIPLDEVPILQWQKRCPATDDDAAWEALAKIKKRDMNDIAAEGQEAFDRWWNDTSNMVRVSLPRSEDPDQESAHRRGPILNILSLIKHYPTLKPPIIHGLVRQGETMNIVAPPKVGKSWLTGCIAFSIILGEPLFDTFPCEKGRVLIIDNELHCETIGSRMQLLADSFNTVLDGAAGKCLDYIPLRGDLVDLMALESYLKGINRGHYKAIILDAFYKFFPKDTRENDNAQITALYNQIDYYAEMLDTTIILVHHASKGNQSEKGVTDVGAGGGAQSRASDCHLVIRDHEWEKTYIIDAAVRSWPKVDAFCARFDFPRWHAAPSADPTMFKGQKKAAGGEKVGRGRTGGENAPTAPGIAPHMQIINEIKTAMDTKSISEIAVKLGVRGFSQETLRKGMIDGWIGLGLICEVRAKAGNVAAKYIRADLCDAICDEVDSSNTAPTDTNSDFDSDESFDSSSGGIG